MPTLPVIVLIFANEYSEEEQKLHFLKKEFKDILAVLKQAEAQGLCKLVTRPYATPEEVIETLQDQEIRDQIAIFHFSGHARSYQLILEADEGGALAVDGKAFNHFLRHAKGLRLVFLNACSTEAQAKALQEEHHVPLVIGTTERVKDEIACRLAVAFYKGLAQGLGFEDAWKDAEQGIFKIHPESDNYRGILKKDAAEGRKPWELYVREGSEAVKRDTLPGLARQPLFNLPIPQDYYHRLPSNPFLSIHRFEERHAPVFFGRGQDIRNLYQLVTGDCPIILFHGQSGVGKSSLLVAGLLPRIKSGWCAEPIRRSADSGLKGALGLALARHGEPREAPLREQWLAIEARQGKPLLVILDQAEESFTKTYGDGPLSEWTELLTELKHIFDDPGAEKPKGKILLSFRKEYLPEIEQRIAEFNLPKAKLFLEKLSHDGIIEAIEGLTKHPDTRREYNLQIEDGLPGIIAGDLLSDTQSALSPVLQILLTRLWNEGKHRHFTRSRYLETKKSGLHLQDFFEREMQTLSEGRFAEAVASGLVLNLLSDHTTPMGTANTLKWNYLSQRYPDQKEILPDLLQALVDRYLLDRFINEEEEPCYSLCHDTLAPVVLLAHRHSERFGQRALRLLESRSAGIAQGSASFKDADDIAALEAGRPFMRVWTSEEEAALHRGKEALDKQRAREAAMRQSNFDFAKTLIEDAILNLDYDLAFTETVKALDLNYEQDQLARLLEEIGFVFHASGKPDRAMEALQVLTGLGLPQYALLAAALPGVVGQSAFGPLLEALQQIPDGGAPLIRARYLGEMIPVQGGRFMMGSYKKKHEQPSHKVTLDGFYLQKTPITFWQYHAFLQYEGLKEGKPSWGRQGDSPAVFVSWMDAARFCNWLSAMEVLQPVYQMKGENTHVNWSVNGYRMPTEAEWEYAAKGGPEQKSYEYSGSDELDEVGWCNENAGNRTQPVALKRPNTMGLYDMSGNVWEWCWDRYGKYPSAEQTNPKGPDTGPNRVLRGGSWDYNPQYCRVADRSFFTPGSRVGSTGFRLARNL